MSIKPQQISPGKSAFIMFLAAFVLGAAIFVIFGQFAGAFSGTKGFFNALTGSFFGWVALFGLVTMIASPFIGLSVWALDRAVKSTLEHAEQQKKKYKKEQGE